ncbi:hypothetical protein SEVIR_4G147602v4 [Setaria viridis]|uniref:Uncharacterized protein n=1 Tax=Setaria viridis TaxID=4556 RepID=A0A4U6V4Q6_SETVI|nr:hypothetical protein SEVIR_4G147602v2 [Setaria viridis]
MLHVGQKLVASTSETNWANGRFYVTVLSDSIYAFAGVDTLAYYRSPHWWKYHNKHFNIHCTREWQPGGFHFILGDWGTRLSDLASPNPYGIEFVKLDWDGHLRVYHWEVSGDWVSSDVLDIADSCSYPLACGEYVICLGGQCSCPDAALSQSGLFDLLIPGSLIVAASLEIHYHVDQPRRRVFLLFPTPHTSILFTTGQQMKIAANYHA